MTKTATAVGDREVTIDRRRKDRRAGEQGATKASTPERRKKPRRRHIDPTTCERDYSQDEIEFMQAMDAYKRSSGRMFPTCSEVLEVIRGLGYYKLDDDQLAVLKAEAWGSEEDETASEQALADDPPRTTDDEEETLASVS